MAAIAAKHLKPAAAARVQELLSEGETLESISAWADKVRPDRPETATWHYINISVKEVRDGSTPDQWKKFCTATGCVTGRIEELAARLGNNSLDRAQRAETLKFLVHFVADMHQPLHAGDRGDRGGNDVAVVYRGRATNLHSVWDTPLVMDWLAANPGLLSKIERGPGFWARRRMDNGTIVDWAWESHDVAREVAYGNLPAARPAMLGDDYLAAAGPAIVRQIERAGMRLARLLNAALAD